MVFGIVLGLALGLVVGVVLHLVRSTRTATAARLAQGRLADAQAMASEQAVRLNELTDAAAAAETARAVLANELDILRRSDAETAARAEEERSRLSGEFARPRETSRSGSRRSPSSSTRSARRWRGTSGASRTWNSSARGLTKSSPSG